jgi:kynurenine--oxoglutarate transaminase/cysteine-S-conjugate beta-lyase/glutamine--phenylpyruvate transaminase
MCKAVEENANQYCRSAGHAPLVQALAKRYSAWLGRSVNWETEVTIGVGATETLYATMQSLLDPGDEAVLISPAFDIYAAQVQMAGATPKFVPLRLVEDAANPGTQVWRLDMAELAAAFSDRTKVILLNSPHNPTGKTFDVAEYAAIADILRSWPHVVAISDEVYEHMVYDGRSHVRLAAQPGMWDRTITVSSSGKTFSITGWKIGWAVGPEALIKGLILTNQWVQFSVSTPSQQAIAACLEAADEPYKGYPSYYAWLNASYAAKRDVVMAGLTAAGLRPIAPEGGFFIIADTRDVVVPPSYMLLTSKAAPVMRRDWALCRFLTEEIKVAAIPPSAFFEGACTCSTSPSPARRSPPPPPCYPGRRRQGPGRQHGALCLLQGGREPR